MDHHAAAAEICRGPRGGKRVGGKHLRLQCGKAAGLRLRDPRPGGEPGRHRPCHRGKSAGGVLPRRDLHRRRLAGYPLPPGLEGKYPRHGLKPPVPGGLGGSEENQVRPGGARPRPNGLRGPHAPLRAGEPRHVRLHPRPLPAPDTELPYPGRGDLLALR